MYCSVLKLHQENWHLETYVTLFMQGFYDRHAISWAKSASAAGSNRVPQKKELGLFFQSKCGEIFSKGGSIHTYLHLHFH